MEVWEQAKKLTKVWRLPYKSFCCFMLFNAFLLVSSCVGFVWGRGEWGQGLVTEIPCEKDWNLCPSAYFNYHSIILLTGSGWFFFFFFAPATFPSTFSASAWEWEHGKEQVCKRKEFFNILDSFLDQHLPVKCC